jgi:hypothetical protein
VITREHQKTPNFILVIQNDSQCSSKVSKSWKRKKNKGLLQITGDQGDMKENVIWTPGSDPGLDKGHW